jgi:hypothetical protein
MRIRRRLARAAEALGVCLLRRFITVLLVVGRQHLILYRVVTGRLRAQRHARRRARDGVAGDAGGGEGCGQHHTRQQQQLRFKGQQPRAIAPPPPPASTLQSCSQIYETNSLFQLHSLMLVQDQAAEILDKRPSQLDAKTGEKTTPCAPARCARACQLLMRLQICAADIGLS